MDWSWRITGRYLAGLAGISFLLWFPFVQGRRVPLLWAADLGFHELGHLLARPFGETIHFLAGSSTQVLVPAVLAAYFWIWQRDHMATGLMLAWTAAAAQDAAVYIADAPQQLLPLIGGHHDWNYLLSHWHALDVAAPIARTVWLIGLTAGLIGIAVCSTPLLRHWRFVDRPGSQRADPEVRPARFRLRK